MPEPVIARAVQAAQAFFALPEDVKHRSDAVDHRGYIGMGDAFMKGATRSDWKESYVVGLELAADDPDVLAAIGPNRSKAFVRKTRVKVKTIDSRVADLLFPAGSEKNWEIDTTPVPSVSKEQRAMAAAEIAKMAQAQAQAQAQQQAQQQGGQGAPVPAPNVNQIPREVVDQFILKLVKDILLTKEFIRCLTYCFVIGMLNFTQHTDH